MRSIEVSLPWQYSLSVATYVLIVHLNVHGVSYDSGKSTDTRQCTVDAPYNARL